MIRSYRYALLVVGTLATASCTKNATCKPGTIFLSITLDAAAAQAKSLVGKITWNGMGPFSASVSHQAGVAQGIMQIDPPKPYVAGQMVTIEILAETNGVVLGSGTTGPKPLPASCASFALSVGSGPADMAMSTGDLATTSGDMSGLDMVAPLNVPCTMSSSCPDGRPICAAMTCRTCNSAADNGECAGHNAATPICDVPTGRCVGCLATSDCTAPANPICDTTTNTCRPCSANSECPTLVCKSNHQCGTTAEVALVDNNVACMTNASPYCEITQAISSMKPYIAVVGSATPYQAITVPPSQSALANYNFSIIGPGRDVGTKARIYTPNSAAVAIQSNSGHTTTVLIDGMELSGAPSNDSVACAPASPTNTTLTIVRSTIDGGTSGGISAQGCAITLDSNLITGNDGGGILIQGNGPYSITNNTIVGNGATSGNAGVFFGTSLVAGTFMFNTVASNGTGVNVGGISCAGSSGVHPVIQASIIWGNSKDGSNTSANGPCTYNFIDYDGTISGATNSFSMDPQFIGGGNYHVLPTSPVKDKVTAASGLTGTLPNHDYDGDARPRVATGGFDVGADQL